MLFSAQQSRLLETGGGGYPNIRHHPKIPVSVKTQGLMVKSVPVTAQILLEVSLGTQMLARMLGKRENGRKQTR